MSFGRSGSKEPAHEIALLTIRAVRVRELRVALHDKSHGLSSLMRLNKPRWDHKFIRIAGGIYKVQRNKIQCARIVALQIR